MEFLEDLNKILNDKLGLEDSPKKGLAKFLEMDIKGRKDIDNSKDKKDEI